MNLPLLLASGEAGILGRFDHWPGIRLHGTVYESRPAHPGEVERWQVRVKRFEPFKGYDLIWKDIHTVRDIQFTHYEPVRVGPMTRHLTHAKSMQTH